MDVLKSSLAMNKSPFLSSFLPFFRSSILSFLLFLFVGCGSPFTDAPPVADSTFVSALAELHLAEARLSAQRTEGEGRPPYESTPDTITVPLPPAVRDSILARHSMSYRQLRSALDYYVRHPEQYTKLYERVVDTLSAEREAVRMGGSTRPGPSSNDRPTPPAFKQNLDSN